MTKAPTPYAVRCPQHGKVGLTEAQRNTQLRYDAPWTCPKCGAEASWDDEHEENYPWE